MDRQQGAASVDGNQTEFGALKVTDTTYGRLNRNVAPLVRCVVSSPGSKSCW